MTNLGNKDVFAKNLKKYMQLNGKTRNEVCQALGLKYTTFTDWVNGKKYPRMDKIEMLANYFGIKKSDLIEDNDSFLIELVEDSNTDERLLAYERNIAITNLLSEIKEMNTSDINRLTAMAKILRGESDVYTQKYTTA